MFARTMTRLDANLIGSLDGGIIMKEVDIAAGIAATRHAGRFCVTAAIDEAGRPAPVPPRLAVDEKEQRRQHQARIRHQIRKERLERLGSYGPGPDRAR